MCRIITCTLQDGKLITRSPVQGVARADRFAEHEVAGLDDEPRSGRPKTIDDAAIIGAELDPPPERLGVSHWSTRLLARHLGVGDATIVRAWRRYHVQPWRRGTFKFSTDPAREAKVPRRRGPVPLRRLPRSGPAVSRSGAALPTPRFLLRFGPALTPPPG
jgi:hypothetical protein